MKLCTQIATTLLLISGIFGCRTFMKKPDSSLKLTPVTIGLRDFANVEILSGLVVGDIVSTGTIETK